MAEYRDTRKFASACMRFAKALGQRVAMEDPEDLLLLQAVRDEIDEQMATAVAGFRSHGFSDTQIGAVLGIKKQSVAERWPRKSKPKTDRAPLSPESDR